MRKCNNPACERDIDQVGGLDVTDDSEASRYYCCLHCVMVVEPDHPLVANMSEAQREKIRVRGELLKERDALRERCKQAGVPWQ